MKFEILDHPAELRLRIYGKTIEELFTNAAEALATIQKKNIALLQRSLRKCYKEANGKIRIQSVDINALLVDFLSEILARSQINKCVYKVGNINHQAKDGAATIEAEIIGYPVEYFDEDIKAITYQDVNINQQPTTNNQQLIWQTDIVLDI